MGLARIYRNLTPDERDQTPQSSEAKHAAAAVLAERTLTKERVGSWSEDKLEKMGKRNSVCKANEAHLREQHSLAMSAKSNDALMGAWRCSRARACSVGLCRALFSCVTASLYSLAFNVSRLDSRRLQIFTLDPETSGGALRSFLLPLQMGSKFSRWLAGASVSPWVRFLQARTSLKREK